MACDDDVRKIQIVILGCFFQMQRGIAYVVHRARISAAGLSDAPVLQIPRSETARGDGSAEVAGMGKVVFGVPVAAVDKNDDGMRAFSLRQAQIDELVAVIAIRDPRVSFRRRQRENVLAAGESGEQTGGKHSACDPHMRLYDNRMLADDSKYRE